MLRLTLVRHAQAAPSRSDQEDWHRPLEARGERDAHRMGQRLNSRGCKPDRILTSPAARALATATIIAHELRLSRSKVREDERLYLASARVIQTVIHELGGETEHLMIVGHNPGLTEFADEISGERSVDNLPTCSVYSLEFDVARWSELEWASGVEAEFDYPRRL